MYTSMGLKMSLHQAAGEGYVVEMRRLVANKEATVHDRDERGTTPLHWAAGNGRVEAVNVLVELGADKEALTPGFLSPLYVATTNGHLRTPRDFSTTKALVQLGADLEAKIVSGATVLHQLVRLPYHHLLSLGWLSPTQLSLSCLSYSRR